MTDREIQRRKQDHLAIVREEDVAFKRTTLLECVQLEHVSLPELDLAEIDTSTEFFGKPLKAPLMITSMTGGADHTAQLNATLAGAAGLAGIGFSVGSQRVMLERPETRRDFQVRDRIPDGVLLGNIGAQQLLEYKPEQIKSLVTDLQADGLCIHLNPAHELAQAGGERSFKGHLAAIKAAVELLEGRVLVKETGNGLHPRVVSKLAAAGVKYIDVAGAGGTSWPRVESFRQTGHLEQGVGTVFGDWGLPTAVCVLGAKLHGSYDVKLVASGGIRNGLDVARAIVIGANLAGFARAVLLTVGNQAGPGPEEFIAGMIHELKAAMLLTGCRDLKALRNAGHIYTGELREWLNNVTWLQINK